MIYQFFIVFLFLFFIFMGTIKLFAWNKEIHKKQLAFLVRYGYSHKHLRFIGLLEIIGAILLITNETYLVLIGATILFALSALAIIYHYRYDSPRNAFAAIITLLMTIVILIVQINIVYTADKYSIEMGDKKLEIDYKQ